MRIYGIDLAKDKFDVNYFAPSDKTTTEKSLHKVVGNTLAGISKFIGSLPADAVLVAEHTGVYGDCLLKCCTDAGVRISLVGGHVIHTYKSAPDRGKTDMQDCAMLREFGERFPDKLIYRRFPSSELYELRQLARHREMLVEERKRMMTAQKGEDCRPQRSIAVGRSMAHVMEILNEEISGTEKQMLEVIGEDRGLLRNYTIITSVNGVGLVTAVEILIKTNNFTTIRTARQYAAYAGTAPYEKSSGKMDKGAHVSKIGNRRSKTLLYICAESARLHDKEFMLYYERRTKIDKKPRYYVLNAIANKLLRIIFTLVAKNEMYDKNFIRKDPRKLKKLNMKENAKNLQD